MPEIIIYYGRDDEGYAKKIAAEIQKDVCTLPFSDKIKIVVSESNQQELNERGEWRESPVNVKVYAFKKEALKQIGEAINGLEGGSRHARYIPVHFIQILGFKSAKSGELVFHLD